MLTEKQLKEYSFSNEPITITMTENGLLSPEIDVLVDDDIRIFPTPVRIDFKELLEKNVDKCFIVLHSEDSNYSIVCAVADKEKREDLHNLHKRMLHYNKGLKYMDGLFREELDSVNYI